MKRLNSAAWLVGVMILRHLRTGKAILTRDVTEGSIALDPPGLELALADVYVG